MTSTKPNARKIAIGDRVAFSGNFLRSTGQHTGDAPRMRGVVTDLEDLGGIILAVIQWDGAPAGELRRVNTNNLARVGSAAMAAN